MTDPPEQPETAPSPPEIDPDTPSPARIYDYWLGGSQNFAADREAGRRAAQAMPTLVAAIRANRAFLRRAVHHLVGELGVTQLLDLGSGVPTVGNVHEVARDLSDEVTVVYVDIDPVAIAHARALLADVPRTEAILADLRSPERVLTHPVLQGALDLTQPVAVLMNAVLHFIPDSEHPGDLVRAYLQAASPGSYLALSHAAPDLDHPDEQARMLADYQTSTGVTFTNRSPEQIASWLASLEIQPPGLVTIDQWRPDASTRRTQMLRTYGVVARKPVQVCGFTPRRDPRGQIQ